MKKIVTLFLLISSFTIFATAIQEDTTVQTDTGEAVSLHLVVPTGFPAITLGEFINNNPKIHEGFLVEYEVAKSPDLMAGKIISGEADIVIAPTNLGAKLYNSGIDIELLGPVIWGLNYVVTSEDISGWEDLKGKEIAMIGRGLTPDIVFRYLLTENGLDPESDVVLQYVHSNPELAPLFIAGKSSISIMPEPMLSAVLIKKPETKVLFNLQEEWAKVPGNEMSYPQASVFISGKTAARYPEFVSSFVAAYNDTIQRLLADPETAGALASAYLESPAAPVIAKAIPNGNLKWISAVDAKDAVEQYLSVLLEYAPGSIGETLPDEGFYYQDE